MTHVSLTDTFVSRTPASATITTDPEGFMRGLDDLGGHLRQLGAAEYLERALVRVGRDDRFVGTYIERSILGNA